MPPRKRRNRSSFRRVMCDCSLYGYGLPPHRIEYESHLQAHLDCKREDVLNDLLDDSEADLPEDEATASSDSPSTGYYSENETSSEEEEGILRHIHPRPQEEAGSSADEDGRPGSSADESDESTGSRDLSQRQHEYTGPGHADHGSLTSSFPSSPESFDSTLFIAPAEPSSDSEELAIRYRSQETPDATTGGVIPGEEPEGQMNQGYAEELPTSEDEAFYPSTSEDTTSGSEPEDADAVFEYHKPKTCFTKQECLSACLDDLTLTSQTSRRAENTIGNLFKVFSETKPLDHRTTRKRIMNRTGITEKIYDICPNSCMSYCMYSEDIECRYCKHPRWKNPEATEDDKKQPYATWSYIPVTHRIRLWYSDKVRAAKLIEYRRKAEADRHKNIYSDYWSSGLHQLLKEERNFRQDTDLAFFMSTDGIKVFKSRRSFNCWPILLVSLNLPPAERYLRRNVLVAGVIPGPKNPKDMNSFLFPLVQEFRELQRGIPGVFNAAIPPGLPNSFVLRAHIVLVGADMVGREKLMQCMGNRATKYCPYCEAKAIRSNTASYCPCKPPIDTDELSPETEGYDPANLPLRTDHEWRKVAKHIAATGDKDAAREHGIKGRTILDRLHSIKFPHSFSPDAMHLFFENVVPKLVKHYRGLYAPRIEQEEEFSDSDINPNDNDTPPVTANPDNGNLTSSRQPSRKKRRIRRSWNSEAQDPHQYATSQESNTAPESSDNDSDITGYITAPNTRGNQRRRKRKKKSVHSAAASGSSRFFESNDPWCLREDIFKEIGKDMAASNATFPAAFGDPVRNFHEHIHELKAAEWRVFTTHLGPIYFKRRLPRRDYRGYVLLVECIQLAVRYAISKTTVEKLRGMIIKFYHFYENRYYRQRIGRLRCMLPVFHQLLHVADFIEMRGPMYAYSQWITERFCGIMARAVRSRVSANKNMSNNAIREERKNDLIYVARLRHWEQDEHEESSAANRGANDKAHDIDLEDAQDSEDLDEDGRLILDQIFTKQLRAETVQRISNDGEQVCFRAPVQRTKVTGAVRSLLLQLLSEEHRAPEPGLKWNPEDHMYRWTHAIVRTERNLQLAGAKDHYKITSQRMARVNNTRASSYIMFRKEVHEGSRKVMRMYFGQVLYWFTVRVTSSRSRNGQSKHLMLAYIDMYTVAPDGMLVKKDRTAPSPVFKRVIPAESVIRLVGIVRSGKDEYFVRTSGSLLL